MIDPRLKAIAKMAGCIEDRVTERLTDEQLARAGPVTATLPTISVLVDGTWIRGQPTGPRSFARAARREAMKFVRPDDDQTRDFVRSLFEDPDPSPCDAAEAVNATHVLHLVECRLLVPIPVGGKSAPPLSVRLESVAAWCVGAPE